MSQYITVDELITHAYSEELKEIIRDSELGDENNDEIIDNQGIALAAIDMAIEYAETRLSKFYDTDIIFSKTGDDRSKLLVGFIKDIAMWYLIGLANVSIDYEDKKFRYTQADNWLKAVFKNQDMKLSQKDFPRRDDKAPTSFSGTFNPKRENRY